MADFSATGVARIEDDRPMDESILPAAISEEETKAMIGEVYARDRYVLDPHTAVGVAAVRQHRPSGPVVCLATAHPAKFPESVNAAVGENVARHPALDGLSDLPERKNVVAGGCRCGEGLHRGARFHVGHWCVEAPAPALQSGQAQRAGIVS